MQTGESFGTGAASTTDKAPVTEAGTQSDTDLLAQVKRDFKDAYSSAQDDLKDAEEAQDFIGGDQWPGGIRTERENFGRPCLTLDHLGQFCRQVINSALMQKLDVRILPMDDLADKDTADILGGMYRQISQSSTARVSYETGLRHSTQVGFGYWKVLVKPIIGTQLLEISIERILEPRTVLFDPYTQYPDGRDAHYQFHLRKLSKTAFKDQFPDDEAEGVTQWSQGGDLTGIPWTEEDGVVVAEYYVRRASGQIEWAICSDGKVLHRGVLHGKFMPIVRCVGEEFEYQGKARKRGMISQSKDAARAYNYSISAFIESVALAPLAPFIAAEGQIEQYETEWKDAHRVPRAVLRYKPVDLNGQPVPPPQRTPPAQVPAGWQGLMSSLIQDQQMILGMYGPSLGNGGGSPVQSGVGVTAQQEPGTIQTYHYIEHWQLAIEQTARVVLGMIPDVYTVEQMVKIMGDDGIIKAAYINPQAEGAISDRLDAYGKVLGKQYNPNVGRYDVAVTTAPSSVTKRQEMSKFMMGVVNAHPEILQIAGDLIFQSMDYPGSDKIAARMRMALPAHLRPTPEDVDIKVLLAQAQQENQQLKTQGAEMEKIILSEREKAQADLLQEKMSNENELQRAVIKSQTELEINAQNNVVEIIVERMKARVAVGGDVIAALSQASQLPTHEERMAQYLTLMDGLSQMPSDVVPPEPPPPPPAPPATPIHLAVNMPPRGRRSIVPRRGIPDR